ncbi:34640_t:CDS:2 [Gigaspora margarita]|uniref:34640_t:CDS:1 n=1 Tax=Gigaspora margarita TaxID=4874 RepID=A0ABN7VDW4_GIGMA|nr:34640_t:CDS:2 [Gigaspora margarita]
MSLSSANEAVLQAIVEILLPSRHRVPELCLLIDSKKQKGSGRFVGKVRKILETEDEESLLNRRYIYWSKDLRKMVQITIRGIINDGINRLRSYMSKGHTVGYSTSGVFDERIKTIKPGPNKLEGFIIVVIGFRRILSANTDPASALVFSISCTSRLSRPNVPWHIQVHNCSIDL